MRKLLFAVYFLIPFFASASSSADTIVSIDSIPKNDYVLDKGWKIHSGDDPSFALRGYDDKNWLNINPTLSEPELTNAARGNMGWLRIHLHVARLKGKVFLGVYQCVAAEIYLNGKLVGKCGELYPKLKTGRAYITYDPIELPLTGDADDVLAIRFANQRILTHVSGYVLPPFFDAYLTDLQNVVTENRDAENYHGVLGICVCVLLLLTVLHLVFLSYNPDKKAHFYFAGYAFFLSLFGFCLFSEAYRSQYADIVTFLSFLSNTASIASALFGVKALRILFNFKDLPFYRWLAIIGIPGVFIWMFDEKLHGFTYYVTITIIVAVQLVLTVSATYHKKRGSLIVAAGFFGALIGGIATACLVLFYDPNDNAYLVYLSRTLGITILCPALGISLFLFREFALDSRLLKVKLLEVEQLSAANLSQEQEKQKILANQNEKLEMQVTERTADLKQSLNNLRSTQNQLIQSAKMASLGELTAGIAHEIQNPLNFVNNFSEVSVELLDELKEEAKAGHNDDVIAIAGDLSQNLEKISHHGKRADAIVKGMLQHSQSGTGTKEPTNINALADECMRLAYHGLRAKDKTFNAELITHFDETLPRVNVIPRDMVRVMLNLFNNAFYAVNQKQKTADADYKPEVTVTTGTENDKVIIKVKDNGVGIPDAIKEKIMQPFFTTKPTGEGTGLGLSLTYDMVVKGHGGSIEVNSVEGEGSEFIINLPVN